MAAALHLLKGGDASLALAVVAHQLEAGDRVTIALLPGASAPVLPPGVAVRRLPDDLSYDELLELVFAADHVVTW
jgi:hypothetical protein